MKGDKFYFVNNIPNPLLINNNLRQTYNTKERKLVEISNIPSNSKVCQTCYKLNKKPCVIASLWSKRAWFIYLSKGNQLP